MDLPWLTPAREAFCSQLISGQQGHAYLLGIHQGYGGMQLANTLAQASLCMAAPTQGGACGVCKSCQLFIAGNHPDCYQLEADGNQIKVDQVRELCQKLTATAQQGGRRVAVIKNCERLNTAAANALLKTLEEPGRETLLLLQSDTPSRLMATISSRCQRLHCQLPSREAVQEWLAAQFTLTSDVTWCLPVVGGPVDLLTALNDGRYEALIGLRKAWVQSLSSGHLCANLTNIDEKQVSDALKVLYVVLRQKLVKQKNADALINIKITKFAAKVMETYHSLSMMPNVNFMAVFQAFILEYQSLTTS
ncbi:DNA polymerase III subunit delta' [Shewanella spartinae]|uniref:DNA polymerase III subunit delta' n=1 Tax=Shewanella spartinae TaxID=2864205 RepID=UPI001C65A85D|nr:DNA polymerase III subunit delta' [Shewanella spartinae]QYJ95321.1 DNA polymerase III subunit delta' [Shewanella spartinae]